MTVVRAMWIAGTQPRAAAQTCFVTGRERVTWWDLYASVAKALGIDPNGITTVSLAAEAKDSEEVAIKRHGVLRIRRSWPRSAVRELNPARMKRVLREPLSDAAVQIQGDPAGYEG